jgi:hypothetical protein
LRPAQWVNIADDGALHALLDRVPARIPVDAIDEIWIFPTRRMGAIESTVFAIATFDDDPERRRVLTAHFTVTRDRKGAAKVEETVAEHASAPAGSLARVVDGVLRRLGDEVSAPPRAERIEGLRHRWDDLIRELGGTVVEPESAPVHEPAVEAAAEEVATGTDPAHEAGAHVAREHEEPNPPDQATPR